MKSIIPLILLFLLGCGSNTPIDTNTTQELIGKAPIANAGVDQTITNNQTLTLDASASSDEDGTIVSYLWYTIDNDLGSSSSQPTLRLSSIPIGVYSVRLVITDNDGNRATDTIIITVIQAGATTVGASSGTTPTTETPTTATITADAGADQTLTLGDILYLDASASIGTIISYQWQESSSGITQTGSTITLSGLGVGTYTFVLIITSDTGATATDSVTITISPKATNCTPSKPYKQTGQRQSIAPYDDGYYRSGKEPHYSRSADVVTDHITGLKWQDDEEAKTMLLNQDQAVYYCQDLTLDGGGWRLPKVKELQSLVDFGSSSGFAIDGVFENVVGSNYSSFPSDFGMMYISNSSPIRDSLWSINFSNGLTSSSTNLSTQQVRCVKGSTSYFDLSGLSRDSSTGIVTDSSRCVMWQDDYSDIPEYPDIIPTDPNQLIMSVEHIKYGAWLETIEYCEDLSKGGYDDWRMPNQTELLSIIDHDRYGINQSLTTSPFAKKSWYQYYWTATTYISEQAKAWNISLTNANTTYTNKSDTRVVRCVRDMQ